ncbi:unnamed protein product, partial [Mesorhabditis spiculigera]
MLAIAMLRDEEHPQIDEAHLIASEQRTKFYKVGYLDAPDKPDPNETKIAQNTIRVLLESVFGSGQKLQRVASECEKCAQLRYEELKEEYISWATARDLSSADSAIRLQDAGTFLQSLYDIERDAVVRQLLEKITLIRK